MEWTKKMGEKGKNLGSQRKSKKWDVKRENIRQQGNKRREKEGREQIVRTIGRKNKQGKWGGEIEKRIRDKG